MKADRGQVEQVLMNLVVNARDAMPNGGTLLVESVPFDVDEEYAGAHFVAPGGYVQLRVSDTGIGMTPEVVARAFEPFFTTKPKGSGSGLGLATIYGIAAQAGGDVVIYSEPNIGTTIRVNFPTTLDAPSTAGVQSRLLPDSPTGETILLVEDEAIVREPARRILTNQGYTVLAAAEADEALRLAKDHTGVIDLVLTDVIMPGKSGKDLALQLADFSPEIKVLFMSGYSHDIIVHQGALEPGVHLIEKPFAVEDLLRKVREVLDEIP
jgi:CheY-like chemotaxis protein